MNMKNKKEKGPLEKWADFFYSNNKFSFKKLALIYFFLVILILLQGINDCEESISFCLTQIKLTPLFFAVVFGLPLIALALAFFLVWIEKNTKMNPKIFLGIIIFIPMISLLIGGTLYRIINKQDLAGILLLWGIVLVSFVAAFLYIKVPEFIRKKFGRKH
ncbi:MAG: hypothetical protein ABH986_03390 [archaeon]